MFHPLPDLSDADLIRLLHVGQYGSRALLDAVDEALCRNWHRIMPEVLEGLRVKDERNRREIAAMVLHDDHWPQEWKLKMCQREKGGGVYSMETKKGKHRAWNGPVCHSIPKEVA